MALPMLELIPPDIVRINRHVGLRYATAESGDNDELLHHLLLQPRHVLPEAAHQVDVGLHDVHGDHGGARVVFVRLSTIEKWYHTCL